VDPERPAWTSTRGATTRATRRTNLINIRDLLEPRLDLNRRLDDSYIAS
jgi:hypothetical protein